MSFTSEFNALQKKRKKTGHSFTDEFLELQDEEMDAKLAEADIAPVVYTSGQKESILSDVFSSKGKEEDRTWFNKVEVDSFGDAVKAVIGSSQDLGQNISAGILGMGEKVVDAGAYLLGGAAGLLGNDEFKDKMGEFVEKDLYNEEELAKKVNLTSNPIADAISKKLLGVDTEEDSVFGEKTDSLAQSGGQLLGTMALQAAGVPWFVTSGVTSFGGEAEGALGEGATFEQAGLSAAISAGAEILTEKLFGGSGLGEKGLINLDGITKALTGKAIKVLADFGIDALAEGGEEVFSEFLSTLGQQLTYEKEATWKEILTNEEAADKFLADTVTALFGKEAWSRYGEAAIGGMALGGFANVGKATSSIVTGTDYRTGLTENEQKVFDRVYEDRVAEAEKGGKKLTEKEKAKLYDSVLNDLERGNISVDTIEEVLGGDAYKTYQDTINNADSLQKEYDALYKMKNGEKSDEQIDRQAELKRQLDELNSNDTINQLKSQLHGKVFGLAKDSKLNESYNERARRGQVFEADVSQYKGENAKKTVQNAIDSGLMYNARDAHDFVDFAAKISEDTGYEVDFVTSAKLAELKAKGEYDITADPNRINALVSKKYKKMLVNMDTQKSLTSLVGHEITHTTEASGHYKALQEAIFKYAKTKGEYKTRRTNIASKYNSADVDTELTADLVGDYLFTDSDFVKHLSVTDRNLFQRIWDEIKYLYKLATAGSREARELERVKHEFEKAYRESAKANAKSETDTEEFYDSSTKYSLRVTDKDTLEFLDKQDTVTTYKTMQLVDGKLYPPMASRIEGRFEDHSELGTWEQATEHPELIKNGNKFKLDKGKGQGSIEAAYNPYMHSSNLVLNDQFSGAYKRDNLVTVECEVPVSELTSGYHAEFAKDSVGWHPWHTGTVAGQLRQAKGTERQVFLSRWIKPVRIVPDSEVAAMYKDLLDGTDVEVPDNVVTPALLKELKNAGVKIKESGRVKYSLSDSDGKTLTKEQSEYFKDSKMRDENGNLKVMYHGSQDAGFHVFDPSMSDDKTSLFFVDRNDVAATYSGTYETYEAKAFKSAEDANKFFAEIGKDEYEVIENNGEYTLLDDGDEVATSADLSEIYREFCDYEGVGYGDANYKVYLNLTNPLEIDAKGRPWNKIDAEFSQEVFDKYQSLTAEEKAALTDLAEWEDFGMFNSEIQEATEGELASAYAKMGEDSNIYDLFSVAADSFSEESMRENARRYLKTRDFAQRAKEGGYDGVIFKNIHDNGGYSNGDEGASTVAIAFDSNQVKSVANSKPTGDKDIRYSLSDPETDKTYLDAVKRGDTEMAQKMVEDVAKQAGYVVRAYHGTGRGDRVGNVFLPERATSGPMAFFTDTKEIAEGYAKSKQDTSMAYDPDFDRYETQFRIKTKYNDIPLYRAWGYLPFDARNRITKKAGQLRENWDGDGELIIDPTTNEAGGGFQWQLKEAKGNAIQALTEQWLNSGNLFNEESRFLDVLEMAGVTEEFKKIGMDSLYFKDPHARHEKVYDTFLKITKPYDTATVDEQFIDAFEEWYGEQDQSMYERESVSADLWDKNSIDAFEFAERLRSDLEKGTFHAWTSIPDSATDYLKSLGYDGIKDAGGKNGGAGHTVWIPFSSEQVKSAEPITYNDNGDVIPLSERFNPEKVDIRNSLSAEGEAPIKYGDFNIYAKDIRLNKAPKQEEFAPVREVVSEADALPSDPNLYDLEAEIELVGGKIEALEKEVEKLAVQAHQGVITFEEYEAFVEENSPRYSELKKERDGLIDKVIALEKAESAEQRARLDSLTDADVPPEMEAPYYESEDTTPDNPFENRDIKAVGNRKVKAYMYENPEVKPFFQAEANVMLSELYNTTKGERWYNDELYYESGGEYGWSGTKRHTTPDIAYLLDECKYTYDEIEKGLKAIIEDNGKENNACSKRIEFLLNDRLLKGYPDIDYGVDTPPNQDYINLLNEKQIREYSEEARKSFFEVADNYAPAAESESVPTIEKKPSEDIAPTHETKKGGQVEGQQTMFPDPEAEPPKVAEVMDSEPKTQKAKRGILSKFRTSFLDKQSVFEDLALKTKNRNLMGKANHILSSESRAQWMIGKGTNGVKALNSIRAEVESAGKTKQFYEYMYHLHNVDRMSLESDENRVKREGLREKFKGYSDKQIEAIAMEWIKRDTPKDAVERIKAARDYIDAKKGANKPVFGDTVTADISRDAVKKYEAENPEFKRWAQNVYDYNNYLRKLLVDNGVISQETADLWSKMYPHYVPVRRLGDEGLNINVPLDSRKTGINAPIKRATGGNRDILPLFDTMAMRTEQTFKAIAKNSFGVELMHTLDSVVESESASLDEVIDSFDKHEDLLQKGEKGKNPTFTVFENGERVTFEITEDIYDALKPTSDGLTYTNKVANTATNIFRGLLTEYNPVFMASNAAKDAQDILINSQHAARTYANIPNAIKELATKGKWYTEYMENGGEQNTYFDSQSKTFKAEDAGIKKIVGMPLRAISAANNFIERVPRLAEYIASRKNGASVEVAMLDAARVTTNFAAGGDVTKFLNRNGATFLNASVQGALQQVRNVREAKANGLKGWVQLAAKVTLAGLPAILLNHLLWEDDEEYEELSDYVKQNYYVVAKTEDGQFVRIPKGRTVAVIQNAFEQMEHLITGDDEADLKTFLELAISNLAPNNPVEDNILAPIIQAANNETWYGEDLVPTRLQDLPAAEQYDESTDAISKWLGEKLNVSPYKLNYLLNQYSGGVGDVFLPMLTPEAERGDNSFLGNMIAPFKDKFTTDGVTNNQNVSDFYDTVDMLTTNAKSSKATDEDVLKYKYINSVNAELGELYAQKREIQNSDLSDEEKYAAVRELQEQINSLARESLATYGNVTIDNGYATIGDLHYRWYEPGEDSDAEAGWQKITDKQLAKQNKVTSGLGISASEYWSNKEEYDYAYDYPEKYAVAKAVGGYSSYKTYQSELYDIKADKDEDGKSISGSRKEKVIDYVNSLDIDYGARLILFKSEYNADDTYNYDIIDYLNSRDDISYKEMETILKELGFKIDSNGNITWD